MLSKIRVSRTGSLWQFSVLTIGFLAATGPAHSQNTPQSPTAAPFIQTPVIPPAPAVASPNPIKKNPESEEEALQALKRHNREQNLRDFLNGRGVNQAASQDLIVQYIARQEESRSKAQQLGRKLFLALAAPAPTEVAQTQLKALTASYIQALNDLKSQQSQAESELEKQLKVSQDIRLKGVLLVLGVTNDAPSLVSAWGISGTAQSVGTH